MGHLTIGQMRCRKGNLTAVCSQGCTLMSGLRRSSPLGGRLTWRACSCSAAGLRWCCQRWGWRTYPWKPRCASSATATSAAVPWRSRSCAAPRCSCWMSRSLAWTGGPVQTSHPSWVSSALAPKHTAPTIKAAYIEHTTAGGPAQALHLSWVSSALAPKHTAPVTTAAYIEHAQLPHDNTLSRRPFLVCSVYSLALYAYPKLA